MLSAFARNAVLAKTRAKYGKRLTEENYRELLNCRTVNEVALYLKGHSSYEQVFKDVKEGELHRGRLEALLERNVYEEYSELSEFGLSVGENMVNYLLMRGEIKQLISFLRYLLAGKPEEYIFGMSDFFNKHTPIDLVALSKIRSYDELLNFLRGTDFYEIFLKFQPERLEELDFAGLENALYAYLYKKLFESVDKAFLGGANKEISRIYKIRLELENVRKIYRMKKYYNLSADEIRSSLFPYSFYLDSHKLAQMLEAENAEDVLEILKSSRYKNIIGKIGFGSVDEMAARIMYAYAHKNMYFSTDAAVVLTCYIILKEAELQNIVIIIEGKRYGLPVEEIKKMLVGISD